MASADAIACQNTHCCCGGLASARSLGRTEIVGGPGRGPAAPPICQKLLPLALQFFSASDLLAEQLIGGQERFHRVFHQVEHHEKECVYAAATGSLRQMLGKAALTARQFRILPRP